MAERRALGEARGAARVLDVDRVVELGRGLALARAPRRSTRSPPAMNSLPVAADEHDLLEPVEVVAHVVDHLHVVGGLERGRGDQHPAAGLAQDVLELGRPVGRVDVDQDDPGLGRRVLDERPLGAVRAPDPDAVAGLDPGGDERARRAVHGLAELRVRVAQVLVDGDERLAIRRTARSCGPGCPRSCRPAAAWTTSRMRTTAPLRSPPLAEDGDYRRRWKRALSSGIVSSGVSTPPSSLKRTRLRSLGSPAGRRRRRRRRRASP